MKKLALAIALLSSPAFAQQPQSTDSYWQRLIAQKEVQSSQQIVELAKALDAANAKIADLTKQLDEKKKAEPVKKEK